ncbi:uncharacterized protein LOC110691684 [Chenopodium quinoa]|uniref:uncharacterized protein LOC110691684 n=1 Tax=Chenopodium quinoa TaxID=63459 RepID=UPI000B792632|nr:uncharacterized protein LOC110691684 [Chenopodium quinoa]
MKYNPGSGCNVVVDGINSLETFLFMRMLICLRPLRDGFAKGCRTLIGLDGCHLKGAFPGQILVAVAKDGNNNLFPLAWATVEIENQETWGWFLKSLMAMFTHDQGAGLTIMSDRQKGLIKAMVDVIPKAEQRFCIRHIWANFKLNYTGSTFKELFWKAPRATTYFEHEISMESIKFLDEEAYEYLANIPTSHWCRHAFTPNCKSNMLLNNMCETFNAVIRPARDKPILTQMEWMRRIDFVARSSVVQPSRGNTFEVQLKDDQVLVDLDKETCTCYHWKLTGIPCVHAYACMLDMRGDIERKKQCSNCGGFGHYAKTCKAPAAPATELIKSAGRPPLNTPWMVEERKKKEFRAAKKSAIGAGPNSIANKKFPQEQEGCLALSKKTQSQSRQPSSSQPTSSQPSSSQPKTKTKASSSQPAPPTVQQPFQTCVVTRVKLQTFNKLNLTQ